MLWWVQQRYSECKKDKIVWKQPIYELISIIMYTNNIMYYKCIINFSENSRWILQFKYVWLLLCPWKTPLISWAILPSWRLYPPEGRYPMPPPPWKPQLAHRKIVLKYSNSVHVSVGTGEYFPVDALPNPRVVVRSPPWMWKPQLAHTAIVSPLVCLRGCPSKPVAAAVQDPIILCQ